jgi:hypothetical protein
MDVKHLGQTSSLPASPEEAVLDYVPNPRAGTLYLVRFAAPEFTSLCPVTGQPDFAHLVIDYAPGETIVESKSLKLFLGPSGCVSAAIGIRVAGSRSMSSGRAELRRRGCGCPTRVWRATAAAVSS